MEEELRLVEDYIETGRFEKALELLERLMQEDPNEKVLNLRAYLYYCVGDHEHALEDYTRIVKQDDTNGDAWYYMSQMAITGNEYNKAKTYIEKALACDPENEDYISNYIGIEQILGNLEHVVELCSRILATTPGSYFALNAKGIALMYRGDPEGAVTCFSNATRENPMDFLSWSNLGIAYSKMNQIEKAGQALQKSLTLNPNYPDAYGHMAYLIFQKGNTEKAFEFVDYAIELDPNNAEAYKTRALMNNALGEKGKAKEDLLTAREMSFDKHFISEVEELLDHLN